MVFKSLCALMIAGLMGQSASFAEAPSGLDEASDLVAQSELVVLAVVTSIHQGTRHSEVTLDVLETYKGDPSIRSIKVRHEGGKVIVKQDEPSFQSYERSVLYLKREADGYYRCVRGVFGKKTLRNENVYLHHENSFITVKLRDYRKQLQKAVQQQLVSPT